MITGKCFALQNDFVSILCWTVEARHEKVEISGQCSHHCNFTLRGSHNWCHQFGSSGVYIDKWRKKLVVVRDEVPCHAFDCPSTEVLLNVSPCAPGLNTQRITTQIDALWIQSFIMA